MWTSTLWLPESRKLFKSFEAFAGTDVLLEGNNSTTVAAHVSTFPSSDKTDGSYRSDFEVNYFDKTGRSCHADLEIRTTITISTLASIS